VKITEGPKKGFFSQKGTSIGRFIIKTQKSSGLSSMEPNPRGPSDQNLPQVKS
jgi:hypothetical protein